MDTRLPPGSGWFASPVNVIPNRLGYAARTVGRAMTTEPTVTEVEFSFDGGNFFLVEASEQAECGFELELVVPRSGGEVLEYFTVTGADPERVLALLERARNISEVRLLERFDDRARFELVTDGHLAKALADLGTPVTQITARAGYGRLTAEVPPHIDAGAAVEGFLAEYPAAELVARRRTERRAPLLTRDQFATEVMTDLTEKQLQVLRVAHAEGYFEWPREITAEVIADRFGVSTPTVSEHLRVAERKVFDALFE